jgi:5,10-methylene-tetrahydrofolate dehydrogenase/methenyl tetrahydrofolate cyclohydrolase
VVSAVGKHNLVTELKPNAVAIDVGISRSEDGKLGGDILDSSKR